MFVDKCLNIRAMNPIMLRIERLRKAGRYDDILNVISSNRTFSRSSLGLTVKGRCLMLGSKCVRLSVIEKTFLKAISIDPNYVDAMIELAWFYQNVMDSPCRAKKWFKEALRIVQQQAEEIDNGLKSVDGELAAKTEKAEGRSLLIQ